MNASASENIATVKEGSENSAAKKAAAQKRDFDIRLAAVPMRLGITREDERRLRMAWLEKGVHWEEIGNGIRYSAAGLALLSEKLAADSRPAEAGEAGTGSEASVSRSAQKNAPERRIAGLLPEKTGELKGEPFLVRTVRCDFPNRHVVEVRSESPAGPGRGFMQVRSRENFLPGMLCWARTERGVGPWVFLGRGDQEATETPVGPRSRGRW